MPDCYAWLAVVCVLCVLNVGWCRAADDDEHVHIKVRMPEVARKHKSRKPSPQLSHHHKYHHLPHHHYHNLHKPYYQPQVHAAQYPNQAAKHGRRAVRPTPATPPIMSHNPHEMAAAYGDELSSAGGMAEHLLYTPAAAQPISVVDLKSNYGPALFGSADEASPHENIQQQEDMLTMPGGTQQLVQHMELMGALAAAAAAAATTSGDTSGEHEDGNSAGGATETNTLLADDFLAELQRTYANGKYPTSFRRKKKYRGAGLAEIGDAAATYALNSAPQQQQSVQLLQQQQQLQLMRQQYQQQQKKQQQHKHQPQIYGASYFMQQQDKPQVQMLRAPPVFSSNKNNKYHNYQPHIHYKNKQHYNSNDIYTTATSDEDELDTDDADSDEVEDTNDGANGADDDHDHEHDYDNDDDDVSLYFSSRPPTTTALSPTPTAYSSGANDYDDDVQQFGYNSHKNNYFAGIEGDGKVGVNPVSYQPTTAYGAYAVIPSTPATATQHKRRPYRQLQQQQQQQQHRHTQQNRYTATQSFGIAGHQQLQQPLQLQQQLITTAQPINVVGPTASDFDDQQTPAATQPQPSRQQQHHKYPMSPRYKKRKNRIKGKLNRNRILTQ